MSIIISFILPIIFFICTIPARGSLAVLQLRLMTIRRANKHKDKLSFSKENLSELALISSITAIKLGLIIWNGVTWILTTMLSLVSSMSGLVFIILIVCVFGAYTYVSSGGTLVSNSAGGITTNVGYNYLAIDWSQDFTSKLNSIEAQYGARVRNWVELVIINMNTVQNTDVKDKFNMNLAWWVGFKGVESSASVATDVWGGEEKQGWHPTTHIITLGHKDGPMQIIDGSQSTEARRNPIYNNCSAQRGSGGSRYYYPDCCYGTNKSYGEYFPNGVSYVADCITSVGAEVTPEHIQLITNMLTANAYNGGASSVIGNGRMSGTCKNLATLLAIFFKNYGWEINEKHIALMKSIQQAGGMDTTLPMATIDLREQILSPLSSNSKGISCFADALKQTGNFGVISPDGKPVDKPLIPYLISLAPANVQSEFNATTGNMNEYVTAMLQGGTDVASFPVYPFSVWFNSLLATDIAVDMLGVRQVVTQVTQSNNKTDGNNVNLSGSVSNQLYQMALAMGKRGTNQGVDRIKYVYGGDGEYQADCARFVYRAVLKLGIDAFGFQISGDDLKNFDPVASPTNGKYAGVNKCTTAEVDWAKANTNNCYSFSEVKDSLQPGDIVYDYYNHVVIYMGKNSKGEEYQCHASGTDSTTCGIDPENLDAKGYSFGFSRFDYNGYHNWTHVIRLGNGWVKK